MNTWIRILENAWFVLILVPTFIHAQCAPGYDPYDWDPCSVQGLTLGGDAIWWKSCISDLDIGASVNTSGSNTQVKYRSTCPDWELGFRVFAGYHYYLYDWALESSWTHFRLEHSTKHSAPHHGDVVSSLLHPELIDLSMSDGLFKNVHGKLDLLYNEWDLLFPYEVFCNFHHRFTPFFGIAGIFLDQEQKVLLKNPADENEGEHARIKWKSEYNGVGIRAGTAYEYRFNPCVEFFAKAHGTILGGQISAENKQKFFLENEDEVTARGKFYDDKSCYIVPGYHITAGFTYYTRYCETNFAFRLGYEFVTWFHIPNPRTYLGQDEFTGLSHSSSSTNRTLGFHGLFGSMAVTF